MTALCCPTCGHEVEQVPMKALADARMSATQRKIVEELIAVYPRDLTMEQLVNRVYADDIDGGPEGAASVLRIMLLRLRRLLPAYGWTIPKNKGGSGVFGRYRLERIGD